MNSIHAIHIIGQILFGGYFVWSGFNHFKNHKMLTGYAASMKVPSPTLAVLGTGALMFLGGLGVLFHVHTNIALLLLVIFLVPTTFIAHAFWKHTDAHVRMADRINFSKNVALVGAALLLMM